MQVQILPGSPKTPSLPITYETRSSTGNGGLQKNAGDFHERGVNARTNPVQLASIRAEDVRAEKESPAAGEAANGADVQSTVSDIDSTPEIPAYATAFIESVADIPPEHRLPILEIAVECYRAGPPIPPLISYMDEANFWADLAARAELKSYLWACWSHLNAADQDAFLKHIDDRRAAA